ncbi:unnamed protein product [Choristocarpus tenellus]|uniref:NADH dehydrogenase subunit 2 n=1 Tax=Choristocarpus tenellus TaxID=116065 RepID=UPI002E75D4F9|nr:NADH dehydrogenase subunit 2 [Choristocarpus tenellus]WBP69819.1 NADH dehydrogenase subunit 2 [Choristocarpus tenellus]
MNFAIFFQNDIETFFPELFLALSLLVVLIHGSFQVTAVASLYTYLSPIIVRLTSLVLVLSLALVINNPVVSHSIWSATFVHDELSTGSKSIVLLALLFCVLVCSSYLFSARIRSYEIFVFFLAIGLAICLLISSYDLLSVYLSIELLSLIFYTLACWKRDSSFSAEAGLKYFVLGALASSFFLFGSSLIYFTIGTTSFPVLFILTENIKFSDLLFSLACTCIGSSLLFKLGVAPFHIWVADVYEGSPTVVSQIFAIIPKLGVLVVLSRLSSMVDTPTWESLFCVCGSFSLFIGCIGGLGQIKLKRLLAYSGIGHMGFICLSLANLNLESGQALFFYILIYIITLSFIWTYVLYLEPVKKSLSLIHSVGLFQCNPILALIIAFVLFSISGIPPLGGFFAKFNIFVAIIDSFYYGLSIFAVLASVLSAIYYIRIVKILYFERPKIWVYFPQISKAQAILLSVSSMFLIFFVLNPNFFYLFSYKMSLSLIV